MIRGEKAWIKELEKITEIELRREIQREKIKEQMAEERRATEKERRNLGKKKRNVKHPNIQEASNIKERNVRKENYSGIDQKEGKERKNNIVIKRIEWRMERIDKEEETFVREFKGGNKDKRGK